MPTIKRYRDGDKVKFQLVNFTNWSTKKTIRRHVAIKRIIQY